MTLRNTIVVSLAAIMVVSLFLAPAAMAFTGGLNINLESMLKLFGIGWLVRQFGPQINDAINTLAFSRKLETVDVTKVVPIISGTVGQAGAGAYIGAAQVSGPKEEIDRVQAVAQVEGDWQGAVRLKVLIPVDNINPLQMKRVFGVGVSALVDVSL